MDYQQRQAFYSSRVDASVSFLHQKAGAHNTLFNAVPLLSEGYCPIDSGLSAKIKSRLNAVTGIDAATIKSKSYFNNSESPVCNLARGGTGPIRAKSYKDDTTAGIKKGDKLDIGISGVMGGSVPGPTCDHQADVQFDDNSDVIKSNAVNDGIFTNIKNCVAGKTIKKIMVISSSNSLNNTVTGNSKSYCPKEFARLSRDRATAMIRKLAASPYNVLAGCPAADNGKDWNCGTVKVEFNTGGQNGDGTSGDCAYDCDPTVAVPDCKEIRNSITAANLEKFKVAKIQVVATSATGAMAPNKHIVASQLCYQPALWCKTP